MAKTLLLARFIILLSLGQIPPASGASRIAYWQAPGMLSRPIRVPESTHIGNSPIWFVENVGQFEPGVRFRVRGSAGAVFLADDAMWVSLSEKLPSRDAEYYDWLQRSTTDSLPRAPQRGVNLRFSYSQANPQPRIEGFNRQQTVISYFLGNDPRKWRSNVPVWGGVRYVDIYPGVDLEIAGEGGRLAHRFVVRDTGAGLAMLTDVRLVVDGARELSVEDAGLLKVSTELGSFTLQLASVEAPAVEQSIGLYGSSAARTPSVAGSAVTFPFASVVGPRALAALPLTLTSSWDLAFSTFLGGSGYDWSWGMTADAAGNVYVTGDTDSANFPTSPGSFDNSSNGSKDVFVTKLNSTGTGIAYSTHVGGNDWDRGVGISLDSQGNAYVAGWTRSTNFPTNAGSFQTAYGGGDYDGFVAKLNSTGTALAYSSFLGGTGSDWAGKIALDSQGNSYVVGATTSVGFPTTTGALQTTLGDSGDAFVTKLNSSGSALVYSTLLGGDDSTETGASVVVDGTGSAYVAGSTYSTRFPTTAGAFDTTHNGGSDAFLAKLHASGNSLVYSTFLGGVAWDFATSIALNAAGNAFVTGNTLSSDFPTTPNAFQVTYAGGDLAYGDAFVTKVNSSGSGLVYSTLLGGTAGEEGRAIAIDGAGNAFIAGYTRSSDLPTTPRVLSTTYGGPWDYGDAFVARFNASGTRLTYSTYLGGDQGGDGAYGIAVDGISNAYVAGFTATGSFPTTSGAFQTARIGLSEDAFVTKLRAWDTTVMGRAYLPVLASSTYLPFYDHFGNPGSGWPVGEDEVASRGYDNGEYRILVKQAGYMVRAGLGMDAADFRVEVDARADNYVGGGYGLYFGSGSGGYYAFQIYNERYWLRSHDNASGAWTLLLGPNPSSAIRPGNLTNRLKVVRRGTTIQLYFNGQLVTQLGDSTFGRGYVGLAASGYQANFEARFDNFLLVFNATSTTPSSAGVSAHSGAAQSPIASEQTLPAREMPMDGLHRAP